MKPYFEFPVIEGQEQERMIRVNLPGAVIGEAVASLGYLYLARKEVLPEALSQEVLGGRVLTDNEYPEQNILVDENGQAKVNHLDLLPNISDHELNTFVIPVNNEDLAQTADQVQKNINDFLTEHPIDPKNSTKVKLEIIDGTVGVVPLEQVQFMPKDKSTKTISEGEGKFGGYYFEGYKYQGFDSAEQVKLGEQLQQLVKSRFTARPVERVDVAESAVIPYTASQYERLAQLAQDNGYGNVTDFVVTDYYEGPGDPKIHSQTKTLLQELNILTDRPSVLVRIVEEFPDGDNSVIIQGCQLQTNSIVEIYHAKEYDPALVPLGLISILGVIAGGIRIRRRRRVLDNERLRKLGLDGPAPSKESFEAVRSGTADTRQKLMVLRYQKATEYVDDPGKHINTKRLITTGCGVAMSGLLSVLSILGVGGDKPDEKPVREPTIHIVRESDDHCSSEDMVAIIPNESPGEVKNYVIDPSQVHEKKPRPGK